MIPAEVHQTVFGSGNIFTGTGDVRISYHLPPAEAEERRVLLQLTASVKQFWIAGVLERSVHEAAMIELQKEARPEAVQHPWERVLELPGQPATSLGPERGIGEVFRETGGALLLLGEPGAGKTITLLELARDLIDRFEKNPAEGVPVVLNLSTWDKKRTSLANWVEGELRSKYAVPLARSRAWLTASRLILLLDGLDEAPLENQVACVQAINAFREDAGSAGVVVCSRLAEYLALPDRLRFNGAVCLQPLTADQVDQFFANAGERLAAVRIAVKTDPLLQELARSPLLLNVLSLAYGDAPIETILPRGGDTTESRRRQLFGAYAQRMFQRTAHASKEFLEAPTRKWLSWLAQRMEEHSLTVFSLDQLQPSWLSTARDRWRYAFTSRIFSAVVWALIVWAGALVMVPTYRLLLVRGTLFAVLGSILAGLLAGWADGRRLTGVSRVKGKWFEGFRVIGITLLSGLVLAVIFAGVSALLKPLDPVLLLSLGVDQAFWGWRADAANGLKIGTCFGLVYGLRGTRITLAKDIWLAESLRFSVASARRGARTSVLPGTLICTLFLAYLYWTQSLVLVEIKTLADAMARVVALLVLEIIFVTFSSLIGGAFGMFAPRDLPGKIQPGEWLRRSSKNGLLAGGVVMIAVGMVTVPFGLWQQGELRLVLWNCWAWGVAAALWYGGFDALQHFVLLRMLRRRGSIPKHYVPFLDYAARLVFLQKVGPGFLFMHRQLREYFAEAKAGVVKDEGSVARGS